MQDNPYQAPVANLAEEAPQTDLEYVGFWVRVIASFIDSIALGVLSSIFYLLVEDITLAAGPLPYIGWDVGSL